MVIAANFEPNCTDGGRVLVTMTICMLLLCVWYVRILYFLQGFDLHDCGTKTISTPFIIGCYVDCFHPTYQHLQWQRLCCCGVQCDPESTPPEQCHEFLFQSVSSYSYALLVEHTKSQVIRITSLQSSILIMQEIAGFINAWMENNFLDLEVIIYTWSEISLWFRFYWWRIFHCALYSQPNNSMEDHLRFLGDRCDIGRRAWSGVHAQYGRCRNYIQMRITILGVFKIAYQASNHSEHADTWFN